MDMPQIVQSNDIQNIEEYIGKFKFDCVENAAEHYEIQAKEGGVEEMYVYAVLLEQGIGTKKDIQKSIQWYETAASNEDIKSLYNLGNIYFLGKDGIEKNQQLAKSYYEKASDQGHDKATFNLGVMYLFGEGIDQDKEQAIKYFKLAAEQGNPDAYNNLGNIYRTGIEGKIEQDLQQAVEYFKLAINGKGEQASAKMNLASIYLQEENQSLNNYPEAIKLLKKAADILPQAMFNLGVLYEQGRGVQKNLRKARKYYKQAYESNWEAAKEPYERLDKQLSKKKCFCNIF